MVALGVELDHQVLGPEYSSAELCSIEYPSCMMVKLDCVTLPQ